MLCVFVARSVSGLLNSMNSPYKLQSTRWPVTHVGQPRSTNEDLAELIHNLDGSTCIVQVDGHELERAEEILGRKLCCRVHRIFGNDALEVLANF